MQIFFKDYDPAPTLSDSPLRLELPKRPTLDDRTYHSPLGEPAMLNSIDFRHIIFVADQQISDILASNLRLISGGNIPYKYRIRLRVGEGEYLSYAKYTVYTQEGDQGILNPVFKEWEDVQGSPGSLCVPFDSRLRQAQMRIEIAVIDAIVYPTRN